MNKIKDIIDTIYYERKKVIIFLLVLLSIVSYFVVNRSNNKNENIEENIINIKKEEKEDDIKEVVSNKVMVDIKGEVNNPGCYEVDNSLRVKDIITLAGGLKEDASTDDINLGGKIYDEMVIVINKKEDAIPIKTADDVIVNKSNNMASNNVKAGKVSINSGTLEELCTLNGIKEARANKIIEYRNTNGPFKNIEDIKNVSGIGESIFAKIKDHITL